MNNLTAKVCSRCKVEQSASQFRTRRGGQLEPYCKDCQRAANRKSYAKHAANPGPVVTKRTCPKCQKTLPSGEFHRNRGKTDGLNGYCKGCSAARMATYFQATKAERQAAAKAWRHANPEKAKGYGLKWRQAHPDAQRALHARYIAEHPEKRREYDDRRRARKANAPIVDFTAEQWESLKAAFGQKCAYCQKTKPLTQDHVIPLSKGGAHTALNILPACKSCNSRKSDRDTVPGTVVQLRAAL